MGVGDDQLHAAQAAARQGAEEVEPERLRLRAADRHAEDLAPAVGVHADRDGHRDGDDAPGLADLHVGGVEPEIGPVALDGAGEEVAHPLVDLGAEARDLAAADALHAHGADQVVHRARRDALDVGLLDHRRQRLLGGPAGLQEGGEVGAAPQLGDPQFDGAGPGLPVAVAVAVALHQAVGAALAMGGAGHLAHLQLHQALRGEADHLAQERGVGVGVDPVSWTPRGLRRRCSRCRDSGCPTRRSSGGRWWSWSDQGERRRTLPASSSRRRSRSANWVRQAERDAGVATTAA